MASKRVGTVDIGVRIVSAALEGDIAKVTYNLRKMGYQLQGIGKTLSTTFTAPLAAIGVASTKMAVDFNRSMANVSTLLSGGERQLASYKTAIQDLSKASGKSTSELAEGMYQVVSALGESSQNFKQLEVATRAGVAGIAKTSEAIDLLSIVTKNYGDSSAPAMERSANLAFAAVREGVTTFGELAKTMGRVVPIAASFNVKQEELWAIMGAGTGVAGNTAEVVTQMRGAITALLKPTEQMKALYAELNTTGQQLIEEKGLVGAWKMIRDRVEAAGKPLTQYLSQVESLNLITAITGTSLGKFNRLLDQNRKIGDELGNAYEKQTKGINAFGHELERLWAQVIVISQKVGDAIIDAFGVEITTALRNFLDMIEDMVDGFRGLSEESQKFVIAFAGIAAAMGPALIALGTFVKLLGSTVLIKITLVTAAIAGAAAAWVAWGDQVIAAVKAVAMTFEETFPGLVSAIETSVKFIAGTFMEIVKMVQETFEELIKYAGMVFRWLADNIPGLREDLNDLADGIDTFTSRLKENYAAIREGQEATTNLSSAVTTLQTNIKGLKEDFIQNKISLEDWADAMADAHAGVAYVDRDTRINTALDAMFEAEKKADEERKKSLQRVQQASKEAEDAVKSLTSALKASQLAGRMADVQALINTGIEQSNTVLVDSLATAYQDRMRAVFMDQHADEIRAAGPRGKELAEATFGEEYRREWDQIQTNLADSVAEKQKKAYEESISFWETTFENAITGKTFDLQDIAKRWAVGFASEFMTELTGSGGLGDIKQLGQEMAKGFLGWVSDGIGSLFGGGGGGLGGENTTAALGATTGTIIGSIFTIFAGIKQILQQPEQRRDGTVTKKKSAWGWTSIYDRTPHPDTQGRKDFGYWFNQEFGPNGPIFFNQQGQGQFAGPFQHGMAGNFTQEGWADTLNADESASSWIALGQAMMKVYGIAGDLGGEIAFILNQQMGGGLDNARLLVAQLGLSFEELKAALVDAAMKGEISWLEFNVQVKGLADAFKPGLEAVGDYEKAFQNLISSGGRGMAAVLSLRNVAIEAQEAGVQNFEELKQRLLNAGFSQEEVDAMFKGLEQRGISTLEELANASDETLGQVVGDMEAASTSLHEQWQQMGQDMEELNKKIDSVTETNKRAGEQLTESWSKMANGINEVADALDRLPDQADGAVKNAAGGSTGGTYARGGVVNSPTFFTDANGLNLMGEAGPEGILPLTTVGGKLGVYATGGAKGMNVVFNVDARGASPGVSAEIMAALDMVEERAIGRSVGAIQEMMR